MAQWALSPLLLLLLLLLSLSLSLSLCVGRSHAENGR